MPSSTAEDTLTSEGGLPPIGEDPEECLNAANAAPTRERRRRRGHSQSRVGDESSDSSQNERRRRRELRSSDVSRKGEDVLGHSEKRMWRGAPSSMPVRDPYAPMRVAVESRRESMASTLSDTSSYRQSGHHSVSPEEESDTESFSTSPMPTITTPSPSHAATAATAASAAAFRKNRKGSGSANSSPPNENAGTDSSSDDNKKPKPRPGVVSVPRSSDRGLEKERSSSSVEGFQPPVSVPANHRNDTWKRKMASPSKQTKSRPGATPSMTSSDLDDMITRKTRARSSFNASTGSPNTHVIESLSVSSSPDRKTFHKSSGVVRSPTETSSELDNRITRKTQAQGQTKRSSKASAALPVPSKYNKTNPDPVVSAHAPLYLDDFEGQILMKQRTNASVESATREANHHRSVLDNLERTILQKQTNNPVSASSQDTAHNYPRPDEDDLGTYESANATSSQGGVRSGSPHDGTDSETPPRRVAFGDESTVSFRNIRFGSRRFNGLIDADVEVAKHDAPLVGEKCLLPRDRKTIAVGFCIVLAITSICVGLTFAVQTSTDRPDILPKHISTPPPTQSPIEETEIFEEMRQKLSQVSSIDDLNNVNSPQFSALQWIITNDPFNLLLQSENLIQRYALMVIYFAVGGSSTKLHRASRPWATACHECDWDFVHCHQSDTDNIMETLNVSSLEREEQDDSRCTTSQYYPPAYVTELRMRSTLLKNSLPSEIRLLKNLTILDVTSNSLSGNIPEQLSELESLVMLLMRENKFNGTISPHIGNLKKLENFTLGENDLTGTVPSSIRNLTSLRELALDETKLRGRILDYLVDLNNVEVIGLSGNRFEGTVPKKIGSLSKLRIVRFGRNNFNGSLPSEIGKLESLDFFLLPQTGLTGRLPSEIGLLTSLQQIDLWDCFLTGTIPSELGLLKELSYADFSFNKVTGEIPSEIGNLNNLETFTAESCGLEGTIPSTFGQLGSLTHLWLPFNRLRGNVPFEFKNLKKIEYLSLLGNPNLVGCIPQEICDGAEVYYDSGVICGCGEGD